MYVTLWKCFAEADEEPCDEANIYDGASLWKCSPKKSIKDVWEGSVYVSVFLIIMN